MKNLQKNFVGIENLCTFAADFERGDECLKAFRNS